MKILAASLILILFLVGCASKGSYDYERLSAMETPTSFELGKPWTLVVLDSQGDISQRMTIVFSDTPAEACGADWKRLEVLGEYPTRTGMIKGSPAYSLQGAALTIDLAAPVCDAHYDLVGEISVAGIAGTHGPMSPWGGQTLGHFYAVPIDSADEGAKENL